MNDPREVSYDVVDVFADAPYAGNQLAVVHDAADLDDAALLAITREFGFSETTFPTPRGPGEYGVRIFTPGGEIPFAGHPTLGTAWVLRDRGLVDGTALVQHCPAGQVGVEVLADGRIELTVTPGDCVGPLPAATVAAVLADLGLATDDLAGDAYVAGTGLDFVHVPVTDDAVVRARPGTTPTADLVGSLDGLTAPLDGINLVALDGDGTVDVHARVFVPGLSVPEDAATGSAAAGLGVALRAMGRAGDGGTYEVRQGLEMGRPSRLSGRLSAGRVHVAGAVHPVMRGTLRVPGA